MAKRADARTQPIRGIEAKAPIHARTPPILLTEPSRNSKLMSMEVRLKPETESRLNELASKSGRATDDLVEDAMAGYLAEVIEVRGMLDTRYDEIKSGRVKPIDGETFFENLRQREDELLKQRRPK
jgi:predicted DNA-binding protein